jgi:hypothetical protein
VPEAPPPLRNQESAPHLRLRRLALPPLRPLPGLQPVPPRRRVGDAGPSKKTVCSRIGRQPESRDTDHSYAGSCVKSISGAATTNWLVLRRSGESAQPTPGPAGVTGLVVFVLPLRRRLAPFFSPPPLLFIVFEIACHLRIEELYVELSRSNLPVIPFWGPTEEMRNIVFTFQCYV